MIKSNNSTNKSESIPVIDIFAGPGGLAEGFSSVLNNESERFFNIKLSIEKEKMAHKTLLLRSFCRQFPIGSLPIEYYEMLREANIILREKKIDLLFKKFPYEYNIAAKEAWLCELGNESFPNELVDQRIKIALEGRKNWVLIGGPPCQAYSLVGRSRNGGIHEDDHRVYLYKQYLRIIAHHQPAVFVMENVKGLLSAKVNGESIFQKIIQDLKNPSIAIQGTECLKYEIRSFTVDNPLEDKDYLIKSENYGIPQKRHRVILLGIRQDILQENININILKTVKSVTLKEVINDLPKIRSSISRSFQIEKDIFGTIKRTYKKETDTYNSWQELITRFLKEFKFLDDNNISTDYYSKLDDNLNIGSEYIEAESIPVCNKTLREWYIDPRFKGVINHQSRSHLKEDLKRYIFGTLYARKYKRFPRLEDYIKNDESLIPDHKNAKSGKFNDRFRVQMPDDSATTITSHISKDGHYFVHYDPFQCRSLTVREAARIQTFPDNYLFRGSRTAQFIQVGNAVPPFLAYQLGMIVKEILTQVEAI